jgi:hypothetical protein
VVFVALRAQIDPDPDTTKLMGPHLMDTQLRDAVLSGGYARGQTVAG